MNEDVRIENSVIDETVKDVVTSIPSEGKIGKILKVAIPIGGVIVVGAAAAICKAKGVFEKRSVNRLMKKGYVIYKAEDIDVDTDEDLEPLDE